MFSEESKLIKKCLSGNRSAWNDFVDQFTRLIYDAIIRTLRRYGKDADPHVLEELHNDVFVTLLDEEYRALRRFKGGVPIACYLRTITVNKTIDHLRGLKNLVSFEDDNHWKILCERTEDFFVNDDYKSIVEVLINGFTDKEVKLFYMIYRDEIPIIEITQRLNVSIDYYYVLKQRLLKKIKRISLENQIVDN